MRGPLYRRQKRSANQPPMQSRTAKAKGFSKPWLEARAWLIESLFMLTPFRQPFLFESLGIT